LLLGTERAADPDLLTVREVAELLRVRPATIYKLCSIGRLPHVRISNAIRISRRCLERTLQKPAPDPQGR
jgi:excisionase family DNA binding protein